MKNLKRIFTIICIWVASNQLLFAQCPANIGFENGDLSGWQSFISGPSGCPSGNPGTPIVAPCNKLTACSLVGSGAQVTTNSRIVVASNTTVLQSAFSLYPCAGSTYSGTDPWSGLPVVCPAACGNNYSLKLGNDWRNDSSEAVRIQFPVSSSNSTLIYYYAAVMENIGHPVCTQPRLEFEVSDMGPIGNLYATPVISTCASLYQATPLPNSLPPNWFISSLTCAQVMCSQWTPVSVNLNAYVGHIIQLKFSTGDCAAGGHFGYAYIDIPCGCNPFHIFTGYCPGEDTAILLAPQGFSGYQWFNGDSILQATLGHDTLIGIGQIVSFPTNSNVQHPSPIPVMLVVTPVGGTACNDTLYDTLRVIPPPHAAFTHQQYICAKSPIQYFDSSYTGGWGNIIRWQWDFGDGTPFDTSQNPSHAYATTGNYTVRLVVWSSLSCVSDTALHSVVNVNISAVNINAGPDITICQGNSANLNGSYFAGSPYKYLWYPLNNSINPFNNGQSHDTTIYNPIANVLTTTAFVFKITDTLHSCVFYDTMNVNVSGVSPNVLITSNFDTICPGGSAHFHVPQAPVYCGSTQVFCNGIPTNRQCGSGTTNLSAESPFNGQYPEGRMQMIFTAPELTNFGLVAGEINSATFNVTNKASTSAYYDVSVKIGCTSLNQFSATSSFQTPLSLVFSQTNYNVAAGFNTFNFQTPYMWDGVSNLILEVCFGGGTTNSDMVAQSTTTFNSVLYDYDYAGYSGCSMTNGYGPFIATNRPTVILNVCSPTSVGYTYQWTSSPIGFTSASSNPIVSPSNNTIYTCKVTDPLGCSTIVSKPIIVDTTTHLNLGLDTTICNGGIYQTHPSVSGLLPYTYSWTSTPSGFTSSAPNPLVSPTVTTTYSLTFSGLHGCTKTDNVVVHVNPIPTSTFTVSPNPVCTGGIVTVTYTGYAPTGSTANWNWGGGTLLTGGGLGTSTLQWSTGGVVTISLTVTANGCSSTTTTYQLTVNQTPTSTFSVSPNPICSGSNNVAAINYTGLASPSANFTWSFVGGTIVSGLGQGPYQVYWNTSGTKNVTLLVTDANCTSQSTVPVTVNQTPLAVFTASPMNVCTGQNINIGVNYPAGTLLYWSWDGGSVTPGGVNPLPPVNQTLVYSNSSLVNGNTAGPKVVKLQVTENGCTSAPDSIVLFVSPSPTSTFTINPTAACSNSNVAIFYTGNGSASSGYTWTVTGNSNPVNLAGPGPFNISWLEQGNVVQNETLTLTVSENGCSTTTSQSIPITPVPTADFTITSPVCAGSDALVNYIGNNAINGVTVSPNWSSGIVSSGSGTGPYHVKWMSAGSYNVTWTLTQNGCASNPFTANVNVLPNPIVDAHPDTTICPGSGVGLWASGANSYVWQVNNSTMPAIYVYPTYNSTTYTVTGTDNNGCQGTGNVVVNLFNPPFVDAGRDTCVLRNNMALIGSSAYVAPNFHYFWTPSLSVTKVDTPLTTANPSNTTQYTLHVTDSRGCNNSDSIIVCVTACTEIVLPNAFAPDAPDQSGNNPDKDNRRFKISNHTELIQLKRFDIYNRWGVKVFSTTDLNDKGWDGTFKGSPQEFGVYTYFIEAVCEQGSTVRKQGNVTLLK